MSAPFPYCRNDTVCFLQPVTGDLRKYLQLIDVDADEVFTVQAVAPDKTFLTISCREDEDFAVPPNLIEHCAPKGARRHSSRRTR